MTLPPAISVIVVSQGRPDHLRRCLLSLDQQYYPHFEVIVVADHAGIDAVASRTDIKRITFDAANISAARNRGINAAAGDLIAFIDDDSVAEPTWLTHLSAAFEDTTVAAATGFVRGRNGISFQWRGRMVDEKGQTKAIDIGNGRPRIVENQDSRVLKLEGTNMMFRYNALRDIGGFDERLHFYLDETDLGYRLAMSGHAMALCPMAQVHHGFAASTRRAQTRAPKSLFEIGASMAVYFTKNQVDIAHLDIERASQRRRLLRYMLRGDLLPGHIEPMLEGFDDGVAAGKGRQPVAVSFTEADDFLPLESNFDSSEVKYLAARPWGKKRLVDKSRQLVTSGQRVQAFIFSPTAIFHHLVFSPHGFWIQSGGVFGRSDRDRRLFRLTTFAKRCAAEEKQRKSVQAAKLPQIPTNPSSQG